MTAALHLYSFWFESLGKGSFAIAVGVPSSVRRLKFEELSIDGHVGRISEDSRTASSHGLI